MLHNTDHKHTNALIDETSPYLLQHAHNPVEWRSWNQETLDLAKKLDKPILVSIGYSSCHWCHVMERESFEDEEVAAIMNENFICIKVDREERPDVDQYYMNAVQLITGGGGWPLNCFALPNTKPIHGGTYFRKPDWTRLLLKVSEEFTNNRTSLEEFSNKLEKGIANSNYLPFAELSDDHVWSDYFLDIDAIWSKRFDLKYGGNQGAPKFPLPNNLDYLMRRAFEQKDASINQFVHLTLKRMCRGGIYDQLGGGFSRYSVDNEWKVPHFEKMLYDNAQLLGLYADAYKQTKDKEYLDVIESTLGWLKREMRDDSGLFYAALDADSEGEEGKYYVWNLPQVQEVLGEDFDLAKEYYQLNEVGYWEEDKFILIRIGNETSIQSKYSLDENQLEQKIGQIRRRLLNVRSKRIAPGLDSKCLTSWNAMMCTGIFKAYQATGNEEYKEIAISNLDYLLNSNTIPKLQHSYTNQTWKIDAFLEDYAFLTEACREAYSSTFEMKYADWAMNLAQHVITNFLDKDQGMFVMSSRANEELSSKGMEYYDNVIPSTNSVMYRNMIWLARFYELEQFTSLVESMTPKIANRVANYPSGYSNWLMGMMDAYGNAKELVIIGERCDEYRSELSSNYLPDVLLVGGTSSSEHPLMQERFVKDETLLYLCRNKACLRPVHTTQELHELYANDH